MSELDLLAARFEAQRPHLRMVAGRMLGSASEADDAIQDAWLRLSRSNSREIENLDGWLTTVVARVCIDMLRSRKSRAMVSIDAEEGVAIPDHSADPERDAVMADSVSGAVLLMLESLSPPERLAFVLHDMFAMPFDDIGPIVGRSPAAARQLASRARRRIQGEPEPVVNPSGDHRQIVTAFLKASREGDFAGLIALLDPAAEVRSDPTAVEYGSAAVVSGAEAVAGFFNGRAQYAELRLIDGAPGAIWAPGGEPRVAFCFTIEEGRILEIAIVASPGSLGAMTFAELESGSD